MTGAAASGLIAKLTAALGGLPSTLVIVVGGLAVGAVAGVVTANATNGGADQAATTPVYACDDEQVRLIDIAGGQRIWIVGRNEESSHYKIHPAGWVRAKAVTAGGLNSVPSSKHFNDQAERYATGNLRDVYFYREDLKGHSEREYHPGDK